MDLPSSLGRRDWRADCPVLPDHVHAQGRRSCQITALWRRSIYSGHQQPLPSFHVPPTQARHISLISYYSKATAAVIAANFRGTVRLRPSPMHRLRVRLSVRTQESTNILFSLEPHAEHLTVGNAAT